MSGVIVRCSVGSLVKEETLGDTSHTNISEKETIPVAVRTGV